MTNIEFAVTLEKLAAKYRENETLPQVGLSAWMFTKGDLATALKGFGGKWIKDTSDDISDTLDFRSVHLPGLKLWINRNKVCRRLVTYECDPIMSPAEEAEMLA